ncbi:MAG: hypothetical protein JWN61_3181, partial [Pseudonocardiales bacterium]|nr:hypothetical protein [Pseudonocardiales bacterium]
SARPIGRTPARFAGYLRSLAVEGSGQPG